VTAAELTCHPAALCALRETMAKNGYTDEQVRVDIQVLGGSVDHINLASSPEIWRGHYARTATPAGACWHRLSLPLSMFDLKAHG
jgi:hypothetical protein